MTSHEEACRRVAALYQPRWLRHYAAGKLRRDGVFAAAYELLRDSSEPIIDVGCGIGLLPFYLRERGLMQPVVGLDIDARKLEHGRAIAPRYREIEFLEQDAAGELPNVTGNVTLFDVLHYLPPARQEMLLRAVAPRVSPDGLVLLRDCPNDGSPRFWATYIAELFAQAVFWNIGVPLHFPTRASLSAIGSDFISNEQPMYGGGPFNNRLFTFRRRHSERSEA